LWLAHDQLKVIILYSSQKKNIFIITLQYR